MYPFPNYRIRLKKNSLQIGIKIRNEIFNFENKVVNHV